MFPTYGYFEKYNKKDRSSCLFERNDGPDLPHLCSLSKFPRASFHDTFFGSWKQRFWKQKLKKKTWKLQSLECKEQVW